MPRFTPAEVTMSFLYAGWTAHPIHVGGQPTWKGHPFTLDDRMLVLSVVDGHDGNGYWSLWLGEGDLADPDTLGDSTSRGAYRSAELGRWQAGIETRVAAALRRLGAASVRLLAEIECISR